MITMQHFIVFSSIFLTTVAGLRGLHSQKWREGMQRRQPDVAMGLVPLKHKKEAPD